ncbi:MAG: apolipoprotein N-acyltransferase [Acidobacteria bacterium]|nr:MAG: apolipoprotein N-acyltransferase [Acidobacteriota bacterium]
MASLPSTTPDSTAAVQARSMPQSPRLPEYRWSREDFLPAVSGLLLAVSWSPINLTPLAFAGLLPLFIYLDKPLSLHRIIRAGVLGSVLFYGVTLNWLAGMAGFSWLAVPGYAIIVFIYACGFFVFILPVVLLKNYLGLPFIATAPFAWVACERLRGYGDLAFPWTTLGSALTRFPFLIQFADVVGVFGVSFWLVSLNVLLFEMISARRNPGRLRSYAAAWVAVFGLVNAYNAVRWFGGGGPVSGNVNVAVLQPNVPQRIKWDERYSHQILDQLFAMNAAATKPSTDLVVWPESAIPYYVDEGRAFNLTEMGKLPDGNAHILTGMLTSSRDTEGRVHYFNAASLFNSHGQPIGRYQKIYLVPGSEQYPFRNLVGFTRAFFSIQDISYGAMDPGTEFTVFGLPKAKFSVMICYESVYPQLSRALRLAGANFLVNITNDAWFGRSFAPYQHAAFLTLRAIENRTAIVRCGNTGISGFVDPMGRWRQKTGIFTEAIISDTVPVTTGLTLYTRCGDLIVYLSYAALAVFFLFALRKHRRVSTSTRRPE